MHRPTVVWGNQFPDSDSNMFLYCSWLPSVVCCETRELEQAFLTGTWKSGLLWSSVDITYHSRSVKWDDPISVLVLSHKCQYTLRYMAATTAWIVIQNFPYASKSVASAFHSPVPLDLTHLHISQKTFQYLFLLCITNTWDTVKRCSTIVSMGDSHHDKHTQLSYLLGQQNHM